MPQGQIITNNMQQQERKAEVRRCENRHQSIDAIN
jgi:hypothetical protein